MKKKDKDQEQPEEENAHVNEGDMEELYSTIENLQKEKDELFAQLQRVSADYANFQKRVPRQISDSISYEKEKIIKSLLPMLDNFEHTLQNAAKAENTEAIAKGVKIIYDQMLDILKSHGVEQMKTLGHPFDPTSHSAMMRKSEPEKDDNIVLEEFQKGYKLNGRVIRPSKVVVNKLESQEQPTEEEQAEKDKVVGDFETTDTE
jgi:molecular chaperone GrpE